MDPSGPHLAHETGRTVARRRGFVAIEKLGSGRYRARYTGPDLKKHSAPITFDTKLDAEGWLVDERRLIQSGEWLPPSHRRQKAPLTELTFGEYAETWWQERTLKPTTRMHYRGTLDRDLLPVFGAITMRAITPE